MEIAQQTAAKRSKDFEQSEYAKGTYFTRYVRTGLSVRNGSSEAIVRRISPFRRRGLGELKKQVRKHGLYHAYRLAIAPTQSISYIQNATSSVMPIVEPIETRTYANSTTYYPMPYMAGIISFIYKSAYQMDQFKMIDLIAEIQQHVDQGISTILHVNSDVSTRQLRDIMSMPPKKGLKSLYYTRTNRLSVEECISCSV